MSKAEIIAALTTLSPEDRAEVQAKLDELAGNSWQGGGELTEDDKAALESALADYARDPNAGSPWDEVKARIQSRLRP
jgi:putative addiction module component (TIGR02574 family)